VRSFGDEDKPSLEELAHHGVKGMKWGVRRQMRRERNQQIKTARRNIANRQAEIHAIERRANKTKSASERAKLDALSTKKAAELFNHPDQTTAARLTSGEKFTTALLIGGSAAVIGASGAVGSRRL
jgi:hypothetical protein